VKSDEYATNPQSKMCIISWLSIWILLNQ
jgi:hypothetical protein